MKFETELYEKVNRRITELRDGHGQAWNEVKFIQLAVDVLCGARQTLMNTYIFAYFVVPTNQTMIFEENQRDLEVATEQLSEYLERDIFKRSKYLVDILSVSRLLYHSLLLKFYFIVL